MHGRGSFRDGSLERSLRFVAERQRAWYRRVVRGEEPPWSADGILRRRRFTNVYRVLDPGTPYAIREILDRDEPATGRLFNVLLYRLIGRPETHAHVGFQRVSGFDPAAFEAALRERRDRQGEPVFTGAYLVSGYSGYGGSDKVENVARLFGDVRDGYDAFWDDVAAASDPKGVHSAIRGLPGFGNFLAYQVLVDLLYPLSAHGGESLLPFSPNEWAAAGPGARRGLELLLDTDGDDHPDADASDLEAMRWLQRNQSDEFDRLGLDFVWLRDEEGDRIELSLADDRNCCCEFYKYETARTGACRTRRRFRPGGATVGR